MTTDPSTPPPKGRIGGEGKPVPTWALAGLALVAVFVAIAAYYLLTPYTHHQAVDGDVLPGVEEVDPDR